MPKLTKPELEAEVQWLKTEVDRLNTLLQETKSERSRLSHRLHLIDDAVEKAESKMRKFEAHNKELMQENVSLKLEQSRLYGQIDGSREIISDMMKIALEHPLSVKASISLKDN